MALSFGGHLAMRAAVDDTRIRGIATVGAPVSACFQERTWWETVPETTVRTLSHLTQIKRERLPKHVADWALIGDELSAAGARPLRRQHP